MMVLGTSLFHKASPDDAAFKEIMESRIIELIDHWNRIDYITIDIVSLLLKILKYEKQRCSIDDILSHFWMK